MIETDAQLVVKQFSKGAGADMELFGGFLQSDFVGVIVLNVSNDFVNIFDKLATYSEIRHVSMETMKFVEVSDFMTKVIFEEIIKESEKMSLKIIDTSFVVMKMMGKSIENNQKMISLSHLTKGKSK